MSYIVNLYNFLYSDGQSDEKHSTTNSNLKPNYMYSETGKFWARLKLEGERPEVQRTILVNDVKYTKRQKREIYLIFLNEQAHECQFH